MSCCVSYFILFYILFNTNNIINILNKNANVEKEKFLLFLFQSKSHDYIHCLTHLSININAKLAAEQKFANHFVELVSITQMNIVFSVREFKISVLFKQK